MSDLRITLDPDFIAQTKKEVTPHWGELGWVLINVPMLAGLMIKIALKIGTKLLNA